MSRIVHRRNLDFLLDEVLDVGKILNAPRYASYDRAVVASLLDTAEAIAEDEFLPHAATLDVKEPRLLDGQVHTPAETGAALRAYAEAGLFGATFDEAHGGMQMPSTIGLALKGMIYCANLPVSNYAILTEGNAEVIASFGTDLQRSTYLPPMLEGRWFGTMCLSEPQAGSSLGDIRTRAEPAPDLGADAFRITGSKMWISGGDQSASENIVHLVLARTPGAPAGVKGLSLFIVPKLRPDEEGFVSNDVTVGGLNHKMGQRATTNCLLNFGDAGDCRGELVGELHNGLAHMFQMMNGARIVVGYSAVMSALAGYLYSLGYAGERLQGRHGKDPEAPPVPIIEHADVRRMLLAQKAAVEGGLALALYCARLQDEQKVAATEMERRAARGRLDLLTPMMKSWPSEYCLEANKLAIQVLGGYGYTRDYPVERLYRDNRLNHIHEGSWGIQALDLLGRKVRGSGVADFDALVAEMRETVATASEDTALRADAAELAGTIEALEAATSAALGCQDLELGTANATPYLDAFGHVVVGWMWLRQAVAARHAAQGSPDGDFYAGKIAAFRYFSRYELPKARALLAPVRELDDVCLNITPAQFLGA